MRRQATFRKLAVISSILVFGSCRHSETAQALGSTAQIARAVEMIRLSSNHDKHLWLTRLRAITCRSPDVCQLKQVCEDAYDEHLKALDMIDLARQRIELSSADAAVPDASAESMLESAMLAQNAQKLLGRTRILMRKCAENEAVIRQRYGLR